MKIIYEKDAINVVHKAIYEFFDFCDDDEESPMTHEDMRLLEINKAISTQIKELPSAQPDVVRCKDCKHRDPEDKKCDCGHDIMWQLPRQDDWYCADAERRTE